MKKIFFFALMLCSLCTAFGAESLKEKYGTFSVIGDSYSTFMGFTDPLKNAQWYPHAGNAMASVNQTWWKLFEEASGVALAQNNSYSGSTICTHSWNNTTDLVNSFVGRVDNLAQAGLIIVEGATNDNNAGSVLGDYVWSNFTDAQKRTFRGGTAYVLDFLQKKYPEAQLIFMLNSDLRADINESVQVVCDHYGVPVLKLHDITKIEEHPDTPGMLAIKEQLMEMLCEMNGLTYISEESTVKITEPKAGADVLFNKAMKADEWNGLCVPFNISAEKISQIFGQGTRVQTFESYTDKTVNLQAVESIEANKPYLVMPVKDISEPIIITNVDIVPTGAIDAGVSGCVFSGTYQSIVSRAGRNVNFLFGPTGKLYTSSDTSLKIAPLNIYVRITGMTPPATSLADYEAEHIPGLGLAEAFTPIVKKAPLATATPIIVADPFLSTWSHSGELNSGTTHHLNGDDNAIEGYVEVDGVFYRFLGSSSAEVLKSIGATKAEEAVQTSRTVTATQSYYSFSAGDIDLDVVFVSPMLVDDATTLEAAINYIAYQVRSKDGSEHSVKFHFAASSDLIRRGSGTSVTLGTEGSCGLTMGIAGPSAHSMTEGIRPNWGQIYLMADSDRGQSMTTNSRYLVFTDDMGSTNSAEDFTLIGRDEKNMAVGFGYARFPAPWTKHCDTFPRLMKEYAFDIDSKIVACRNFDAMLFDDAERCGGADYAVLCQSVYRQVIASCKTAVSDSGKTLLYNIDAGDSWQISQSEKLLAIAPLFLMYNPSLAYALFEAVPDYISMYPDFNSPYGNAPHHLGVWPIMAGINLDHGVDATTSLCILAGAAVKCGYPAEEISENSYQYLCSLCTYLDLFTLPQYQGNFTNEGSADGNISNNANLRLKCVLAMRLVSDIAAARGENSDSSYFLEMSERWESIFRTNFNADSHYRHGYDLEWGQKYPLFYDKALGLDIFEDVLATELAYYATLPAGEFGLPLDARSESSARLSANLLTAASSDNFSASISPLIAYINREESYEQVADRYNCLTGEATSGKGSGSLGSAWAKVLAARLSDNSGVENVTVTPAEGPKGIFDLQGRKINGNPAPGIYIINGRKTAIPASR